MTAFHKRLTDDACDVVRTAWFGEAETVPQDAFRIPRPPVHVDVSTGDRQGKRVLFATARRA
jgi:hypothetical protein